MDAFGANTGHGLDPTLPFECAGCFVILQVSFMDRTGQEHFVWHILCVWLYPDCFAGMKCGLAPDKGINT